MTTKFKKALAYILSDEDSTLSGKVTTDNGGRTRFGIAEKSNPKLPADFYSCEKDKALAIASSIYEKKYWRPAFDALKDDAVAAKVFDMAVNMGDREAEVLTQRAARAMGCLIDEDGVIGDKSLAAMNALDPQQFMKMLCEYQEWFYRRIAANRPEVFADELDGLVARARRIPFQEEKKHEPTKSVSDDASVAAESI